ncbi:sigma factor [Micromonospora zamorensis]|uniref:sigma factor n=1 Tax=Micromonospora zamorensis TaxID=709883 RepID=UPI00369A6AA1
MFEEYVLARGPALMRLACLLTGDDHQAEDLVQDVLARAFVRWPKIVRADRPDAYVRRMLVNANASWWRRSSREVSVSRVVHRPGIGDLGADAVERDAMRRLIMWLPQRQRAGNNAAKAGTLRAAGQRRQEPVRPYERSRLLPAVSPTAVDLLGPSAQRFGYCGRPSARAIQMAAPPPAGG